MNTFALALLLIAQEQPAPQQGPPTYESAALAALVERAAAANRAPPQDLRSFRARVETELSFVRAETDGRETILQLEQVASDVYWRRDGGFTQQLLGYRAQTLGATFSGLSFFDVPWLVPTLYGERLDLVRTGSPSYTEQGALLRRRALHPFAPARDEVYRYTGGDTVDIIQLPGRRIPILRIEVTPHAQPARPTLLFHGHIDVDATRMHIVRMVGRLIPSGRARSPLDLIAQGVLFISFETAEYDEIYWLPRTQRFEAQAVTRLGEGRVLFRAVSRFVDVHTNDPLAEQMAADPAEHPFGLVLGRDDLGALGRFGEWRVGMGDLNAESDARDFDRYGPPGLVPGDAPRLSFGARYLSQIARYNEVEGMYTGAGLVFDFGRAAPGVSLRVHGGWAWGEGVARGGAELSRRRAGWEYILRGERQLAHTNDFTHALDPEPGVPPLLGADMYDFVDRWTAGAIVRTQRPMGLALRFEAARVGDRNVGRFVLPALGDSLPAGWIPGQDGGPPTRPGGRRLNRPVDEGDYWLGRAEVRRNPSAGQLSLQPGLAARLAVEAAAGELEWQRVEAGASLRRVFGRLTVAMHADGGVVLNDAPPLQALLELGTAGDLPGFSHKAFTGDRAALGRAGLMYTLPLFNAPIRLGTLWLPGPAPSPSVSVQVGWTDARAGTLQRMQQYGWSTSDGAVSAIDLRMRFFGGSVSIGAARPLDRAGTWRFVWGLAGGI